VRLAVLSSVAAIALLSLAVGCLGDSGAASPTAPTTLPTTTPPTATALVAEAGCRPPQVQYTPYPGHGDGLSQIPWVRGEPRDSGLVALLWYWPQSWQQQLVRDARIFTGGVAPAGYNVKVMWVFLARSARDRGGRELVVEGQRLDGPGRFRDSFSAIGYAGAGGAPSYASTIVVPAPGCWRLNLSTGRLRARVDFRAVSGES
jgi:hypothetical protein